MVQTSTSKLIAPPLYHIKGKSVMKACWTDMPCNCWGEHCGHRIPHEPLHAYSVALAFFNAAFDKNLLDSLGLILFCSLSARA